VRPPKKLCVNLDDMCERSNEKESGCVRILFFRTHNIIAKASIAHFQDQESFREHRRRFLKSNLIAFVFSLRCYCLNALRELNVVNRNRGDWKMFYIFFTFNPFASLLDSVNLLAVFRLFFHIFFLLRSPFFRIVNSKTPFYEINVTSRLQEVGAELEGSWRLEKTINGSCSESRVVGDLK
jgi:hypothetical protein